MPPYYEIDNISGRIPLKIFRQETPLTKEEKQYLLAVERGDLPSVRRCLQEAEVYFNLNINCVDSLGRSSLLIAIQNENTELIKQLLSYNVHVGDALLHAINEEAVETVELLLNYKSLQEEIVLAENLQEDEKDTDFSSDITPVILAAHRNNYEILKLLLERGATIPKPHSLKCGCNDCESSRKKDGFRHSRSRLDTYRALASPSLIALASEDPILTAFELSWELRRLSKLEIEFKKDYEELQDQCIQFARDLLDEVRGSNELEIILNRDSKVATGKGESLSRLKLAIKYKQKPFVAHPNCQQLLLEIWYQGLPGWRRQHWFLKFLMCCTVGLAFPILSIVYLLAPNTRISKFVRLPFLKFISHSASYFVFLFLLVLDSQHIGEEANRRNLRGTLPTDLDWLIIVWIIGILLREIKQLHDEGIQEYASDWWNLMDFIMLALYIAVIGLKITSYQQEVNSSSSVEVARENWDRLDPTLMADAVFSIANIFSFLRLILIFTASPHLGPLRISLGRMIGDITKFFMVFVLVLFAFAVGLNQLYWYYSSPGTDGCLGVLCETQNNVFSSLFQSFQTLVWVIFGHVDLGVVYLNGIDHHLTEFVGASMMACYAIITVIVLINMLIAMMNTSFLDIQHEADQEWKFARSKFWINYFEEGSTLPPPFNIIPSPKFVYYSLKSLFLKIFSKSHNRKKTATRRHFSSQRKENDAHYQDVMRKLIKRYITNKKRGEKADDISEDDLNELKQDFSAFRYEMLEIFSDKRNQKGKKAEAPIFKDPADVFHDNRFRDKHRKAKSQASPIISQLRVASIKEENYTLPEFLKVNNVVTAVNKFTDSIKKKTRILKRSNHLDSDHILDAMTSSEPNYLESCSGLDLGVGQDEDKIELSERSDQLTETSEPEDKPSTAMFYHNIAFDEGEFMA